MRIANPSTARHVPVSPALRGWILSLLLLMFLRTQSALAQDNSIAEATRFFAAGSYDQACHLLETSLKDHPQDAKAHLLLGKIYTLQGRRTDAIQQFTKAIELQPNSATAYDTLGTALNRFAEFDLARKAFEQAITLDPNFAQAHLNLAMSLAQVSDSAGATEQLQTAIRLQPSSSVAASAHYLLAKILADQDGQRAMDELTAATRIEPRKQEAWLELGRLKGASNDEAGALTALKRAVACDPHDPESQYELGSEYLTQGDARQAVLHLEMARKSMPKVTVAVLYKLDRALRKQGSITEAQRVREEAKTLLAQDIQANQDLFRAQNLNQEGLALEGRGEVARALEDYHSALELNPQQNGFRLNYALALCRLNRWRQGIDELNQILESDPGNIEARRALYIAQDKARQASSSQPATTHQY
jgi:tetratricopeptide (TPR) repeat protein